MVHREKHLNDAASFIIEYLEENGPSSKGTLERAWAAEIGLEFDSYAMRKVLSYRQRIGQIVNVAENKNRPVYDVPRGEINA